MFKTKYIVFEDGHLETMIIFPETQVHATVARRLCGRDKVVSAGFLQVGLTETDGEVGAWAYGESESLGVKSRPEEDSKLAIQLLVDPN